MFRRSVASSFLPRHRRRRCGGSAAIDYGVDMHLIIGPIRARSSAAFALVLVLVAASAGAQQAAPPGAAPAQTQPAPSALPSGLPTPPEVIGAIGRFIDQSITNVGAGVANVGARRQGRGRNAGRGDQRGRRSRQRRRPTRPARSHACRSRTWCPAGNGAPSRRTALPIASWRARRCARRMALRAAVPSISRARASARRRHGCKGAGPPTPSASTSSFVARAICQ